MNNRALTLSLVMAFLAVFFVQSYVSSIEEGARKKFGTEVLVVQAKRDIKEMETITEAALELKTIPKTFLEPATVFFEKREEDKEVTKSLKALAGAIAIVPIKKGEQITYNKLTEPSLRTGLAPQITPGRRAMSVPVTETSGVSKLVKPGDRVDLIGVLDMGGGKEKKIAKVLLQDVIVLSVGRAVTNNVPRVLEPDPYGGRERVKSLVEDSSFTSVSLEVEPAQAEMLALILNNSDNVLSLALRNNDDTDRINLGTVTYDDILGADIYRTRAPANRR